MYIIRSSKGVGVQNLLGIDSAVTMLHMREMSRFCVDFFVDISFSPSIRFFCTATGHSFRGDFNAQWLKRRDCTSTISALWGLVDTAAMYNYNIVHVRQC